MPKSGAMSQDLEYLAYLPEPSLDKFFPTLGKAGGLHCVGLPNLRSSIMVKVGVLV